MTSNAAQASGLEDQIEQVEPVEQSAEDAHMTDIVRQVLATLDGDLSGADVKIYSELEWFLSCIEGAKREIEAIRPQAISDEHIPAATDQLDAIVSSTEEATNAIMEAAEEIEGVASELDETQSDRLIEATTKIFEACSFQDLTGQRIGKVVSALKQIEAKVDGLIRAVQQPGEHGEGMEGEVEDGAEPEVNLLEGPQLPANARDQKDIDALFDSI